MRSRVLRLHTRTITRTRLCIHARIRTRTCTYVSVHVRVHGKGHLAGCGPPQCYKRLRLTHDRSPWTPCRPPRVRGLHWREAHSPLHPGFLEEEACGEHPISGSGRLCILGTPSLTLRTSAGPGAGPGTCGRAAACGTLDVQLGSPTMGNQTLTPRFPTATNTPTKVKQVKA